MSTSYLQKDAQNANLVVAFGLQTATGNLSWAKVSGTSPTHQITAFNALGEGEWNACLGAYWKGDNIPSADYEFNPGALATGLTSGPQQRSSYFTKDIPHTRTATIGYKIPLGLGSADIEGTRPDGFEGIFETKKCADYNSSGTQTDFSYSPNPARVIAELLTTYARIPNLPASYVSDAAYWIDRIDWSNWVDFRAFHDETETVDYTTLTDFPGFGLTASYYNGTAFDTFVTKFVHPNFDLNPGSAAPALGVTPGNFSARFEGFIKAEYSETYTFHLTHDNGVRLYIAPVETAYGSPIIDQFGTTSTGTHTGTYAMTAGTFYKIKLEWNDGGSPASLLMEWSSTSQAQELIPSKRLYPLAESQNKYEFHGFFNTPTSPGAAIRTVLYHTNSIMQDVNGKLRFYCLDQLSTPSFTFDEDSNKNIEELQNARRKDLLQNDPITEYEAKFKDLDSQYLSEPPIPVSHPLDMFGRAAFENVKILDLYNTTRWRARKILQTRAKFEYSNDLRNTLLSPNAKSYVVMPGDLISVKHRKIGTLARDYLVIDAKDKTTTDSGVEMREFTIQEWD